MSLSNDRAHALAHVLSQLLAKAIYQSGCTCGDTRYVYLTAGDDVWLQPDEKPSLDRPIYGVVVEIEPLGTFNILDWVKSNRDRVVGWWHKTNKSDWEIALETYDEVAVSLTVGVE